MGNEQEVLQLIRDELAKYPAEMREKVEVCRQEILKVMIAHGEVGSMALALIGAEMAARIAKDE